MRAPPSGIDILTLKPERIAVSLFWSSVKLSQARIVKIRVKPNPVCRFRSSFFGQKSLITGHVPFFPIVNQLFL